MSKYNAGSNATLPLTGIGHSRSPFSTVNNYTTQAGILLKALRTHCCNLVLFCQTVSIRKRTLHIPILHIKKKRFALLEH